MKLSVPSLLLILLLSSFGNDGAWLTEKHESYSLLYTDIDKPDVPSYSSIFDNGTSGVEKFFGLKYKSSFSIYIHPGRRSLDSAWRKDWNMPDFRSECWMVASGTASKLDIIAPKSWTTEACEHKYSETIKTQQLITHELVHVFHGQRNMSPDFSNTEGIDWLVEGLATYASGQCDSSRMDGVKRALADGKVPARLDDFWTGNMKYGLSGSMVKFIDNKYGRAKLIELLKFNKKSDVLLSLKTTEVELMEGWKKYLAS